ncbi:helix-turn-helix domain-containing protein [Deinococcus sp. QL22]|uniref:helix-turn-helix domain-containing protein n=1 Tax=Deinococcus sp. QL22 TaxID=2939437 RepID=UPI0020180D45|nr:helix-turn-helix domain-containing protein [Deinococcus sp. QL22]UQN10832.1 helix-turn-helix domain-containing protein [Deinococcus sp. QL22]
MDTNVRIRHHMRQAVKDQGLTHAKLARLLAIQPPAVSQLMSGTYGKVPQSLIDALTVLGLELTVVKAADAPHMSEIQAKAEAMSLLSMNPWGKKPKGLEEPVEVTGPAFEELLQLHRGPDL